MSILNSIINPSDLKKLNIKQLEELSKEIREEIIDITSKNGGHLASSLGAVDAIVALYYVFDFPKDKLIFDVGHQAYAHKILSERAEIFNTIRTKGGLSGFPNIFESDYDAFSVGHAGTSIAASLGYANARDSLDEDYYVISFVGDASMFNGENLESLMSSETKPEKLLIILNDNGMSISKNTNGLYKVAAKISMKKRYSKFMSFMNKILGWNFIGKGLKKIKFWFKRSLDSLSMLDNVGIKYIGAFDGNNIKLLVRLFSDFKATPRTTLLHLKTVKGKGYEPAENSAEMFHGVSKDFLPSVNTFSQACGDLLIKYAKSNDKISVITAGMALGTGVEQFSKDFSDRFYDVGICEEYAVTFSAGLALGGLRPIICIYSTFLQRCYDQILMDVCLQNLPVIFMVDRAGVVGSDGCTHQGVFDLSYLRQMPNMTVLTPKDKIELDDMMSYALSLNSPVAIRYPNGIVKDFDTHTNISSDNLWEKVSAGKKKIILACGARALEAALEAAKDLDVDIYNARSVKPLDYGVLNNTKNKNILTIEDNVLAGGFGSSVLEYLSQIDSKSNVKMIGVGDKFIEHAKISEQLDLFGLNVENIRKMLKKL